MFELYHNGYRHALHLDWLQFSVTIREEFGNPNSAVTEILNFIGTHKVFDGDSSASSKWYHHSSSGPGWSVFWEPKAKTQNYYCQVELRGEFFKNSGNEQVGIVNELLDRIYSTGCGIIPSRVDVALDCYRPVSRRRMMMTSSYMAVKPEYVIPKGETKEIKTGYHAGRGDFRFTIYDKRTERIDKGYSKEVEGISDWWRYELQMSGKGLKNQFFELPCVLQYYDFLTLGAVALQSKKVEIYPSFFKDIPGKFVEGELVKYCRQETTLEGVFRFIDRQLVSVVRKYASKMFQKFGHEMNSSYYPESDLPFDVEEYLEKDGTPPEQ